MTMQYGNNLYFVAIGCTSIVAMAFLFIVCLAIGLDRKEKDGSSKP